MAFLRICLILLCCCGARLCLFAQQESIVDSLENLVKAAPNDSVRMMLYGNLCTYLNNFDNERCGAYARKMLALTERKRADGSIEKRYPAGRARATLNMGIYHDRRSEYTEALQYFFESLTLYEPLGPQPGLGTVLSGIGNVYADLKKWDEAEAYYLRSKEVYEKIGRVRGVRFVLLNMGAMLGRRDRPDEALQYYLQAEKTFSDPKDRDGLETIYTNIGRCYRRIKQYAQAHEYFDKAAQEYERSGQKINLELLYAELATLSSEEGQYEQARLMYETALTTALAAKHKEHIMGVYNEMVNLYLAMGERENDPVMKDSVYRQAFRYNGLARSYGDSILNQEKTRQIAELQVRFDSEKQAREISQLTAEAASKQIALLRQEVELRQRRLEADRAREQAALLEKTNDNFELELKVKEATLREQHAEQERQEHEIDFLNKENTLHAAETRRERAVSLGLALVLALFAGFIFLLARLYWQRTQANRAILAQNQEIERQRREIEAQNHRLELAGQYKNAFFSNLSHEIRTPLNTVINVSALLEDTPLDESQRDYTGAIRHASANLLGLLNDILDFSKIEAGKLELRPEPLQLRELLRQQVDMLRFNAVERGLQLTLDCAPDLPEAVIADGGRLNQVLLNLIGNALKFTEKGRVTLACRRLPGELPAVDDPLAPETVLLEFSIKDTGIGIAPEKLSHIFDAFVQADSDTHTRYGGTGLGLAITKQLVELQGGTLSAESKLGEGSIFRFTLPVLVADAAKISGGKHTANQLPAAKLPFCRILLVEDNLFNQQLARELLGRLIENPYIALAAQGAEALEKTAAENFDLILMDVRMPVMDGFEATRRLRERGLSTPIIALTANATTEEEAKCRAAGMDDYVSKPIDPKVLQEKIALWARSESRKVSSERNEK